MATPRPFPSLAAAVVLAVCLVATGSAGAAEPIGVNKDIVVTGEVVRLSHLFSGLPDEADADLARAPAPGRQVRLSASWLHRVARAYGVDWRPPAPTLEITVRRASQRLDAGAIRLALAQALAERGVDGDIAIRLDNPDLSLTLPMTVPATATVTALSHDPTDGRFTASLAAPDANAAEARATVTGRVVRMIEVPVPARRIGRGGIIGAGDLEWRALPAHRLSRSHLTDAEAIVGKSARRAVRAGRPLRASDIEKPVLVARNGLVTITLETARMRLTAQGRALEDGARGEVVRVVNTKSKTTVSGVVTASNVVTVRP